MIDRDEFVNGSAYMDFKEATDFLFQKVDHGQLASELRVSVASIRQARLKPTAGAHRTPPPHWEKGVANLAAAEIERYRLLLERLGTTTSALDKPTRYEGDKDPNRTLKIID